MALNTNLSISTLAPLYRSGALRPQEIVDRIYDRIEAQPLQPTWIHVIARSVALERAHHLASKPPGPLYGIPFAIKDNIDVAGIPTTAACPAYRYVPDRSASV